jgi:4-hydroxy-tetrahydrodipicolinate reductase
VKIVLHGYGKMGHAVERIARERGHDVVGAIGREGEGAADSADVLIDFSNAAAVENAVSMACDRGIGLVLGTTGWADRLPRVRARVMDAGIACVHASNFSVGANVVFALARQAGAAFGRFDSYAAGIEERHHAQKKDAPSGTALRIAAEVREGSDGRLNPAPVSSRVGSEVGLHTLFFDSQDDLVEITHRSRNRDGFARGAVIAAELIQGRKGFFSFDELMFQAPATSSSAPLGKGDRR